MAAKSIHGMTLHTALSLSQMAKGSKAQNAKADLVLMWTGVEYLFIDKVSMVGCELLVDISVALGQVKHNTLDFGSIGVIFAGDFCQLAPVGGTSLYADQHDDTIVSSQTVQDQKKAAGRLLWLSITSCVILHQQMRQAGENNILFQDLLHRLSHGNCSNADHQLLSTRILGKAQVDLIKPEWRNAPIITCHNIAKDALNRKAAHVLPRNTENNYIII